jgi:hypothetical protein
LNDCIAPIEKFRDYIFKPDATHGKDHVFRSLGFDRSHSEELALLFEQQAVAEYSRQEFSYGMLDKHGQRISIEIELEGIGDTDRQTSYLISGWMIRSNGNITLNTPFSGFAR